MKRMRLLAAAGLLLLTTACGGAREEAPVTRQTIAMDTVMEFTLYGAGAGDTVQAAVEEIQRLEGMLSKTDPDSEVSQLNARAGERVEIQLTEPARAPTPGQLAVFYDGDVVVGSAWIERSAAAWS